jgi:hypothetical protein
MENAYKHVIRNPKSTVYKIINIAGPRFMPLIYMIFHFCFFSVTSVLAFQALFCEEIHMAIICVNGWWCVWSGANYYMEYFSRNNENRLKNLEKLNTRSE